MLDELFQECVKEAIRPVDNPDDRMLIAHGYSKLADLKVAEMLTEVRKMAKKDLPHTLAVLDSRIKELEASNADGTQA